MPRQETAQKNSPPGPWIRHTAGLPGRRPGARARKQPAGAMGAAHRRTARPEAGRRRKKQPAGAMDGPAGVKKVAGTGSERTGFSAGKQGVAAVCDAKCDAISADRAELLARAVLLVAGMAIPESERAEVLARVVAEVGGTAPT